MRSVIDRRKSAVFAAVDSVETVDSATAGTQGGSALCHARVSTDFRAPPGALLLGLDYHIIGTYIPIILRFWGMFISASVVSRKFFFLHELLDTVSSSHTTFG